MRKPLVILSFWGACIALGSSLGSCSKESGGDPTAAADGSSLAVIDVDPEAAAELLAEGTVRVLDVRTPQEYAVGHISNALNHDINGEGFEAAVNALDQSRPYLVHCAAGASGGRSRRAVEALRAAGATKIYHLDGGFTAWKNAGLPTE